MQIVFEEFGFNSLLAAPSSFFSLHYACSQPVVAQPPGLDGTSAAAAAAAGAYYQQQQQPPAVQLGPQLSDPPEGRLSPAAVAAASSAKAAGAGIVIDAGFSACYVVPFYDGQLLTAGIRRLNLGGKALTNLLKETVSYRSLNMGDEGLLMEQLKEQLCWVSKVSLG
jgi:actin-related protein